ncbi:LD-carboxypeptidase [Neisseriaceae bacterium PsAf]|nr:LD-carboxypeptidase [Neisseriaceae bacterium PsAf]
MPINKEKEHKNMNKINRRDFLTASGIATAAFIQACTTTKPTTEIKKIPAKYGAGNNVARFFASSGYIQDYSRINLAISRFQRAGFSVNNQEAAYRRYRRFSGTDAQRAADFQDIVQGRTGVPKLLLGVRGGYGAMRILPMVDWGRLGAMMREHGTMLFGFSDTTAIQLALMARGQMVSFSGPMVYSDFGNPNVSSYTIKSFIECVSNPSVTVVANGSFIKNSIEGVFWGGNLSVLSALVGSAYMPKIEGGILFIEDVGEQPYRIERMLQTLYLSGILSKQKAIVLGNFKMGDIVDQYDSSYNLTSVIATMSRLTNVPIFTNFPFGHVTNKATMPLGAVAKISPNSYGYSVTFSQYPHLDPRKFNLSSLMYVEEPTIVPDYESDGANSLEWE